MTTPTLSHISDAEAALILAVRGLLRRPSPNAPLAPPQPAQAMQDFNPAWKTSSSNGRQFTQAGVNAIAAMFRDGLSNSEVARRMRIGIGSAATYRERYEGKRPWGRFKPQPTA